MSLAAQRGVALIQALLVVALATSVAVAMVSRQQFDIRRTANLLQADQASLYADGVEAWAAQILRRDRVNNQVDHGGEEWATLLPPIPVEGGSISGHIEDLQGRFNLNSLVEGGAPVPAAVERFRRLLGALRDLHPELVGKLNMELAEVVIDWIDGDQNTTFPGGAEDDIYMSRDHPYRTANAPMTSPSELLLLEGMDAELYAVLLPHVATLPVGTKFNVNTATAPVLMSLASGLSPTDAELLIEGRGDEGYASVEEFLKLDLLAGRGGGELGTDILTVQSDYFLVISQVQFGALSQQRYSVLQRQADGASHTLMRAQGTY